VSIASAACASTGNVGSSDGTTASAGCALGCSACVEPASSDAVDVGGCFGEAVVLPASAVAPFATSALTVGDAGLLGAVVGGGSAATGGVGTLVEVVAALVGDAGWLVGAVLGIGLGLASPSVCSRPPTVRATGWETEPKS
jgi:hypothetical protein